LGPARKTPTWKLEALVVFEVLMARGLVGENRLTSFVMDERPSAD
jgi:hypothetical protein